MPRPPENGKLNTIIRLKRSITQFQKNHYSEELQKDEITFFNIPGVTRPHAHACGRVGPCGAPAPAPKSYISYFYIRGLYSKDLGAGSASGTPPVPDAKASVELLTCDFPCTAFTHLHCSYFTGAPDFTRTSAVPIGSRRITAYRALIPRGKSFPNIKVVGN